MMGTALSGLLEMCLATACLLPHSSPATDPDPHVGPQIIGLSHAKLARECVWAETIGGEFEAADDKDVRQANED